MADMIAKTVSGADAFGFVGERGKVWHGKGQQLEQGASIEEWTKQAGFDWDIVETPALFQGLDGKIIESEEKKVLYRSDTGAELSVVGTKYKVVQPKEVLEFFRDMLSDTGMHLDTAGMLFGGRRFFANANTQLVDYVGKKEDTIKANLALVTSADGSLQTMAMSVATRIVCWNTCRFAMNEGGHKVKVSHKSTFDPTKIKQSLGLINDAWENFIDQCNRLASKKISDADVAAVYQKLLYADPVNPSTRSVNQFDLLMSMYKNSPGADMVQGNMYGAFNGLTYWVDHSNTARTEDAKVWSKLAGNGHELKQECFDLLMSCV